jgi:hypothetical protein
MGGLERNRFPLLYGGPEFDCPNGRETSSSPIASICLSRLTASCTVLICAVNRPRCTYGSNQYLRLIHRGSQELCEYCEFQTVVRHAYPFLSVIFFLVHPAPYPVCVMSFQNWPLKVFSCSEYDVRVSVIATDQALTEFPRRDLSARGDHRRG